MSDALTAPVVFLHNVFIICLTYVVCYNLYFIIIAILWFFGITGLNPFIGIPIIPMGLFIILYIVYRICVYIVIMLLVLLFWIFVFWMLIIIFVPFIIIFPIPIFPFVFILPLKPLMLLLIPPFKTLTDLGTLPLTYRVLSRLINGEIFYNFVNYFLYPTGSDVANYLYFNVNQIIQEAFGYDIEDYFKPNPMINDDDLNINIEENDNPDDIQKYNEYKSIPNIKKGMRKIDEETNLCVNMRQKFKLYNSSYTTEMQTDAENSFSPYNECYTKAIKSYLKTSII